LTAVTVCFVATQVADCISSYEKLFTVVSPRDTQNECLYVAVGTRKSDIVADPLLRIRPTFSKSLRVSVSLSTLSIRFVEPGVKINGQYYRDVLLMEDLIPEIRKFSKFYIFQRKWLHLRRMKLMTS